MADKDIDERLQLIKDTLKAKGLNYEQLSEMSKIPKSTIMKVLSGNTKNPRLDTVKALLSALDLDISTNTMSIPKNLENVPIAFSGKLEQLTQEDMEDVSNYIDFIIAKKKR